LWVVRAGAVGEREDQSRLDATEGVNNAHERFRPVEQKKRYRNVTNHRHGIARGGDGVSAPSLSTVAAKESEIVV
jgi:hypothetical protein